MPETAGITPALEGLDGVAWNVLGQIYVPKQITQESFAWHATFPIETSMPIRTNISICWTANSICC